MSEQIEIEIEGWVPVRRGPLRGYATILLPGGMRIHSVALLERDGNRWVNISGRMRSGQDGVVIRHRESGKVYYTPAVSFTHDTARQRFERSVIAALLRVFPRALDPLDPGEGGVS